MPETPSPEVLKELNEHSDGRARTLRHAALASAGRHIDVNSPGKGRVAKVARTAPGATTAYLAVCHQVPHWAQAARGIPKLCATATSPSLPAMQAAGLFGRIRQAVACRAAPATLKSAFLEPLSKQLAAELSVSLLGRNDDDFMSLFTGRCGVGWRWGGVG